MTSQYSELTDPQWKAISEFFDVKRKRSVPLRSVVNAILYIARTGIQWRNLPPHFPKWRAVYYYFEQWNKDGTMDRLNLALNQKDRKREGREALPSVLCIDSQSVKLTPMIYEHRGTDGNKKVNGRKRQLIVDVGGRIFDAEVHAANLHDGTQAAAMLPGCASYDARLKKVLGDQGYQGGFAQEAEKLGLIFECASKPESAEGFVPVAKRWVVERTIAWTNFFRRLTKDYEHTLRSAKYWLFWGNISIILNRID
jgi:transposase